MERQTRDHLEESPMLFVFNDTDDRERASDGVSRYGAYLRQNADRFTDWDGEAVTTDPAEFARAAWEVATSPIMAPPYLEWAAERVQSVTFTGSEYDGSLITRVQVATPRPNALRNVRGFADWHRDTGWPTLRGYHIPGDADLADRPAMLPSVLLVFAIGAGDLYLPQDAPAALTVADAQAAVKRLAALLDARLAPVLSALDPAGGAS
ncbi:hypothetical protein [Actinomadura miaoliensis]|uniref:DUF317 domain-containing protein n=1 Tax=Actinomadura miaoliensis TaxID=430685 RepID=A0ABP7V6U5_9ACTN